MKFWNDQSLWRFRTSAVKLHFTISFWYVGSGITIGYKTARLKSNSFKKSGLHACSVSTVSSPYHFSAQNAQYIEIIAIKLNQMKHENGSCDRNFYDCVKKKIQDFNGTWTRHLAISVRCSTNRAMQLLTVEAGQFWVHMFRAERYERQ